MLNDEHIEYSIIHITYCIRVVMVTTTIRISVIKHNMISNILLKGNLDILYKNVEEYLNELVV